MTFLTPIKGVDEVFQVVVGGIEAPEDSIGSPEVCVGFIGFSGRKK